MSQVVGFVRLLAAAERLAVADSHHDDGQDAGTNELCPATNHEKLFVFVHQLQANLQEVEMAAYYAHISLVPNGKSRGFLEVPTRTLLLVL